MPLINWYLEFQLCAGSDGARKSGSSSSVFSLFNLKEKSRFWSESVIRSGDMFFLLPSRICNRKVLPLDFIVLSISCVFPPQSLRIYSLPVLAEWLLWTSPMQVVITGLSEMMRWVHFMRFGLTSIFFLLFQCFLYLRKTKWEFPPLLGNLSCFIFITMLKFWTPCWEGLWLYTLHWSLSITI